MDWTLRSGTEQEMPSQPQGLGSLGRQLVSRCTVALKASLSSSNASPATKQASKQETVGQHSALSKQGDSNSVAGLAEGNAASGRTVRGEGHGGGRGEAEAEEENEGRGGEGGAQARRYRWYRPPLAPAAASPLPLPPPRLNLVHGGGGGGGGFSLLVLGCWEDLKEERGTVEWSVREKEERTED